jgi:hypothetical protein
MARAAPTLPAPIQTMFINDPECGEERRESEDERFAGNAM